MLAISGDTSAAHAPTRLAEPAPVELTGTATGTLEGVGAMTTAGYSISAPTGKQVILTLSYGPYDAGEAHRVGFSIWQNGVRILRKNGLATGYKDNINSSQPSGSVTPAANEPLLIKVFNFNTLSPISYTVTVK